MDLVLFNTKSDFIIKTLIFVNNSVISFLTYLLTFILKYVTFFGINE